MKNPRRSFLTIVGGFIIVLVLAGGVCLYLEIKNTADVKDIDVYTGVNGKCGLTVSSPLPGENFAWPLEIGGKVVTQKAGTDCSWQTFEGVSGTAQLYFDDGGKGWKSAGDSVIFGPEFRITFNYEELGLPTNTALKVVFTEENPAAIRPSLVFELPLILK